MLSRFLFFDIAHVGSGQIMGWGEKAIEVRSLETGLLDGVFTHKRAQQFRFLCERNEKVFDFEIQPYFSSNLMHLKLFISSFFLSLFVYDYFHFFQVFFASTGASGGQVYHMTLSSTFKNFK